MSRADKASRLADRYTYRVIWSDEDKCYFGLCAEHPGLSHFDNDSGAEAYKGIRNLVASVVNDMLTDGDTPPEPISTQRFKGHITVRVPPDQHRDLVLEAAEQNVSLNRLISRKLSK